MDPLIRYFEGAPDGVFILDAEWRFCFLNARAEADFATDRPLLGQCIWEAFPQIADSTFAQACRRTAESGAPETFRAPHPSSPSWYDVQLTTCDAGLVVHLRNIDKRIRAVKKLYDTVELYRLAARATSDLIWDRDGATGAVQWNEGVESVFGHPVNEVGVRSAWWNERIHPDDLQAVADGNERALATGLDQYASEYRFRKPDGTYADVYDRGYVLRDADGNVLRTVGAMQDVTERKSAMNRLRERERELEIVFGQARVGIIHSSLDAGILMVNERFCQILDRTPEELARLKPSAFTHPEDIITDNGLFALNVESCSAYQLIKRYIRPDGEYVWCAVQVSFVRGDDGQAASCIVVAEDITARRRAEQELAAERQLLQTVIDSLPDLIFVKDAAERFILTNRALAEGCGDLIGRRTHEVFDAVHADVYSAADRQVMADGHIHSQEQIVPIRGEPRVFQTARVPWRADDEIVGVIGVSHDMTERKQIELALARAAAEAEAASIAKSVFLATMSHEIRTPLNGVLGMAQAMAQDELTPPQRGRIDVIRQSGGALLAILNDVLDLSKIEAGKLDLEEIDFDLGDLLHDAQAAFTSLANKDGLSFALDISGADGVYRGDPTRIRQVLYNLISNALKFTEAGSVRVTAAYEGGALRLAVADTGIGLTPEAIGNLFTAFVQADATTTRRFGGTGLGLAITQQLVELMGGAIAVASTQGQGSTFTVTLPLPRVADALAPHAHDPHPAAASTPARDLRVLAAEDNATNQLVLQTLLNQVGIEPCFAKNGAEAIRMWGDGVYDLILMDVQMPVIDGPDATRQIRALERAGDIARIPIIGLTANAMTHQVREYLEAGMDAVVTKPIEIAQLFRTMEEVLS